MTNWTPLLHDRFVVDVGENIGYLIHDSGAFVSFPVVTGQRRTVSYIGRTYNASTPVRNWAALSMELKDDHTTFGVTGRFLRLYKDGTESTSYGIHGHASAEKMLAGSSRYRSMGCIIVSEPVLDLIERTFYIDKNNLLVVTMEAPTGDGEEIAAQISTK